jgi:hypothetical protein
VGLDDVHGPLEPFLDEQRESGGVLQDLIGGIGFIRELEPDAAVRVADDPHTHVGVEAAGRRVGSGQDLDRPVGERQHAASLGGPATKACVKHVPPSVVCNLHGRLEGFDVTCQLVLRGFER